MGTSWQSGKNRRLLCNDFQSGKCNRDSCKFEHVCGVLLPGIRCAWATTRPWNIAVLLTEGLGACLPHPLLLQASTLLPPHAIHVAAVSKACEPKPVDHCEVQLHNSPEPSAFLRPHDDSFCEVSLSACVEPMSPSCEAFFPDTLSRGVRDDVTCSRILQLLRGASWPSAASCRDIATPCGSGLTGYWNFGVRASDRSSLTNVTSALPRVLQELNLLLAKLWPTGSWNAVCIACNRETSMHRDLANAPHSRNFSVSLGDFTGGCLWVQADEGTSFRAVPGGADPIPGVEVSTHNAPICFDPTLWHCTLPFVGERWAITCYTLADVSPTILAGFNFPSATDNLPLQVSAMAASPEGLQASEGQSRGLT